MERTVSIEDVSDQNVSSRRSSNKQEKNGMK